MALNHAKARAATHVEVEPKEIAEWRLHDLRRTAATHMTRLGVERLVVSKILNHAEGGVTKGYDRHRYETEKRHALTLWSERLRAIVEGSDGGNVVSIASGRGS